MQQFVPPAIIAPVGSPIRHLAQPEHTTPTPSVFPCLSASLVRRVIIAQVPVYPFGTDNALQDTIAPLGATSAILSFLIQPVTVAPLEDTALKEVLRRSHAPAVRTASAGIQVLSHVQLELTICTQIKARALLVQRVTTARKEPVT